MQQTIIISLLTNPIIYYTFNNLQPIYPMLVLMVSLYVICVHYFDTYIDCIALYGQFNNISYS